MTRLDWEKANRQARRRPKGNRKRENEEKRQMKLVWFADKNNLSCFSCSRKGVIRWAKSGISTRGPWIICVDCVCKHKKR